MGNRCKSCALCTYYINSFICLYFNGSPAIVHLYIPASGGSTLVVDQLTIAGQAQNAPSSQHPDKECLYHPAALPVPWRSLFLL